MKVAICDDEVIIAALIEKMVLEYSQERDLLLEIEVFSSGEELIAFMEKGNKVDLLFLDIVFSEGMNGVEIGEFIRNRLDDQLLKLVYVSGQQGYDRQLFDYQPMNFIEKPIRKVKVFEAVERAIKLLNLSESVFVYSRNGMKESILYGEILYFESHGRKIGMHTRLDEITFYGRLKEIEEQVVKHRFIRIHRCYIVNYAYIVRWEREQVTLKNGTVISVGETYLKEVQRCLCKYEMGNEE